MNRIARLIVPVLLIGLVAACGGRKVQQPAEDSRSATGEVLPGTISDAMIHTDRLSSHPPLLKNAPPPAPEASDAPAEQASPAPEMGGAAPAPPAPPPSPSA